MKIGTLVMMLILGVIGLIVGYLIFGRVAGDYVSPVKIFSTPEGLFDRVAYSLRDIESMRQSIIISGIIGSVLGLIISLTNKFKKRT